MLPATADGVEAAWTRGFSRAYNFSWRNEPYPEMWRERAMQSSIGRRSFLASAVAGAGALALPWQSVLAQASDKTLRVGMTLSDIPLTSGQATQGAEGIRFTNLTI